MKRIRLSILFLLLAALVGYGPIAVLAQQVPAVKGVKPGVIQATALNKSATYCHLHFPAIDPKTLSGTPALLPADTGDIVDFYGPCDHDPLGYDEVCRQKMQAESNRGYCDGD
jgi:hypothetical protein